MKGTFADGPFRCFGGAGRSYNYTRARLFWQPAVPGTPDGRWDSYETDVASCGAPVRLFPILGRASGLLAG